MTNAETHDEAVRRVHAERAEQARVWGAAVEELLTRFEISLNGWHRLAEKARVAGDAEQVAFCETMARLYDNAITDALRRAMEGGEDEPRGHSVTCTQRIVPAAECDCGEAGRRELDGRE